MSQVEIYDLIMSIGYKRLNCKARHGVIPYSFLESVLQVYVTNVCFLCAESMRHKCSAEMTQVHFFISFPIKMNHVGVNDLAMCSLGKSDRNAKRATASHNSLCTFIFSYFQTQWLVFVMSHVYQFFGNSFT